MRIIALATLDWRAADARLALAAIDSRGAGAGAGGSFAGAAGGGSTTLTTGLGGGAGARVDERSIWCHEGAGSATGRGLAGLCSRGGEGPEGERSAPGLRGENLESGDHDDGLF
jgi:hypothetical protein